MLYRSRGSYIYFDCVRIESRQSTVAACQLAATCSSGGRRSDSSDADSEFALSYGIEFVCWSGTEHEITKSATNLRGDERKEAETSAALSEMSEGQLERYATRATTQQAATRSHVPDTAATR